MRGLLVKDFKLLKLQKNFLFVLAAIAIGTSVMNENAAFIIGYFPFVMSMFTLTTITYDEFDNGNAFLFTLPISRRSYVMEKYVFSLLLGGSSWALSVLLAAAFSLIKGTAPILEIVMEAGMILPILLLVHAVMIPFQLKFGGEKGRLAIAGAVGALFFVGVLTVKIAEIAGIDLMRVINALPTAGVGMLSAIADVAAVMILLVSVRMSISIMNKKEF